MAKFGAKEVMDVTFYEISTSKPVISFDSLKTSGISFTSEQVKAKGGKSNATLATWDINKEGKLTMSDALLSPRSLELVSGIATATGSKTIPERQQNEFDFTDVSNPIDKGPAYPLTCSNAGLITLAHTPSVAASAIYVYLADDDCGTRVDMTGATLSANTLTLGSNGIAVAGTKAVVVYYEYASPATSQSWTIAADKFASTYKMVGRTVIRNVNTGKDEAFVVKINNIKFSSNLNLDFASDGDPAVQEFECEIMREANNYNMCELIKI